SGGVCQNRSSGYPTEPAASADDRLTSRVLTCESAAELRPRQDAGMKNRVLLITGVPGVGKTTVMRRVKGLLAGRRMRGFLTDEIRSERGERLGFQIETLDGQAARLAGVGLRSPNQVGRYGVDLDALDAVAVPALAPEEGAVYLIDEIGKMECLSGAFTDAVARLLDSTCPVI